MMLLALLLFLDAAADTFAGDSQRPAWAAFALGFLAVTPLVMVHLRSAYVDLPVGLLAATCALRLARCLTRPGERTADLALAALAAIALGGLKDEGIAHVAAIAVAAVAVSAAGRGLHSRPALWTLAAAALPFAAWRVVLALHHVDNPDHALQAPDVHAVGPLAAMALSHLADVRSWGALWPLALAGAGVVLARFKTFLVPTQVVTLAFLLEAAALAAALAFGSPRVRTFAFEGTLLSRLLIQLAPTAGVMLALVVSDAFTQRAGAPRPAGPAASP
jgi:hypothetical protein